MSLIHHLAAPVGVQKLDGFITNQTPPYVAAVRGDLSVVNTPYNAVESPSTGEAIPQYSNDTGWNVYDSAWGDPGISVGPDTTGVIVGQQADLGGVSPTPTDSNVTTAYGYGNYNG